MSSVSSMKEKDLDQTGKMIKSIIIAKMNTEGKNFRNKSRAIKSGYGSTSTYKISKRSKVS
jgi:hypothetical protein